MSGLPPESDQRAGGAPSGEAVERAGRIVARLQAGGHRAYFVGGAVRDWLLCHRVEDVDIATSARPEEVARIYPRSRKVGAHFGVMLVGEGGQDFEVATFRAEGGYVDRRRPSRVRFGTLEEDWPRRDFTVNAMYFDPVGGRLIDPAGGRADLRRKVLRTVGSAGRRFTEDALRLMRAVRFCAAYGLEMEPATWEAIREHAALVCEISAERVGGELLRMLQGPRPGRAVRIMGAAGLWRHVSPEIERMRGCPQPPEFHPEGDVFTHTALVLERLAERWAGPLPAALALGALLHDVGKPVMLEQRGNQLRFPDHHRVGAELADRVCRRLRFSTRTRRMVKELVAQHMRFMDVHHMKASTLRRFLAQEEFGWHLALHRADCEASHGKLANWRLCKRTLEALEEEQQTVRGLPAPLLNGHDLMEMGVDEGPRIGRLLEALRDEQLEGRLKTRAEAEAWVRARLDRDETEEK